MTRDRGAIELRKYGLALALILAPCLALCAWVLYRSAEEYRVSEKVLQQTYEDLAAEVAGSSLHATLTRLNASLLRLSREKGAARLQEACLLASSGEPVEALGALDAEGRLLTAPESGGEAPLNKKVFPTEQTPAGLLLARRKEFVEGKLEEAARAYSAILDTQPEAPIREEAWLGLLGVLLKGKKFTEALERYEAVVHEKDFAPCDPEAVGMAALEVAMGLRSLGRQGPAASLLLKARERLPSPPGLAARRLDAGLARMHEHLPPTDSLRYETYCRRQEGWRRMLEMQSRLTAPEIAWLGGIAKNNNAETETHFHRVPDDTRLYMARPLNPLHAVLLLCVDLRVLQETIRADLKKHPGLANAAHGFKTRYGKAVVQASSIVNVATPWDETMRVPLLEDANGAAGTIFNPVLLMAVFLASGMLMLFIGVLALMRAARKDIAFARMKSDFVSGVSHELKTPLALIRMFADMLRLGYAHTEAERKTYAQTVSDEAERLTLLVNNVLDFSRIEKGKKVYCLEPMRLEEVVHEVLERYKSKLEAEGFELVAEIGAGLPPMKGDKDALAQVLLNLLANAMHYSPQIKRITVRLAATADEVVLSVSDRGIGIASNEQKKIFDEFYRVDQEAVRRQRGTGLGLALVKHVVEGHGGRVDVESVLGAGSTFRVRLPLGGQKDDGHDPGR